MSRTGYKIEVYMDANPYSPTYGQERTDRILDTTECVTQQPANYVHVYTYCEMNPNGSYTGNCVQIFEDVEPLSPTYGQQMEQVSADGVLCPPDSTESDWQTIDTYCEQIAYQPSGKLGNSGYMVTVQQDMSEYSPTYGQTRENKVQDIVHCPTPNTDDTWVIISETCHLVDGLKDGTKDVVRVNTNEYSPNYNDGQPETINVEDLTMCPLDPESPVWTEISYVCVTDEGYRTGYVTVTEEDTNPQSASYGQTRTRTYEDTERCPYQPKPQPVTLKWRVINNRSASTDIISHITMHFNGNYDIDVLGSVAPAGGMIQGTIPLPASLTSTGLVCSSITLSPNTSLPTQYQFSQSPNPFVWEDTTGSAVLTVTLWDGDGTGPEWTEISYTCETVSGYRTGASIITEEDMNPDSATYGETRTRTVENDSRCPAQTDGDWVETSWSCQQENGYNTGYVISVQTDQNPNSSTYNTTRTRLIYDTTRCPISTTAGWTEVSYVCEKVNGYNSGIIIVTEQDMNPNSATYGETRTRTYRDLSRCPLPSQNFKLKTTASDSTVTTLNCDSSTTLTRAEVVDRNCVSAVIGDCVETIGNQAFLDCTRMTSVTIGNYVTTINQEAFYRCDALTSVNVPYGVTSIGQKAFWSCGNLVSAVLPDGITAISDYTFYDCTSLATVNIPSGVTSIGRSAFSSCTSLQSIDIPNTVTSIGNNAFGACTLLRSITIPNSVITVGNDAFNYCTRLSSVTISNSVTSIGNRAFYDCWNLQTVTIPSSVTSIGYEVFQKCTSFNSLIVEATTPPTLSTQGTGLFDSNNDCPIYVPSGSVSAYQSATGWSTYASRIQAIP